jgi:hypothetical protein
MEHQEVTTAVLIADHYPPELVQLCQTAVTVLHEHVEVSGRCIVCGVTWPCELARLAEHNLALL